METKPGRLCSWESVLLAECMLIHGSCKTNPVPGSCCYCKNVKAVHPPQTGTKNQQVLTEAALAALPAQAIPKYSLVFSRMSPDSLHERKAPWLIKQINPKHHPFT